MTVSFGGLTALENVSLCVAPKEIVGLIGPNGAGKTTLFNVICGFVKPRSGRIVFRGVELRRHHPHDLARLGIARTLQGVGVFAGMTVIENVMTGVSTRPRSDVLSALLGVPPSSRYDRRARARALQALERTGVANYASSLPATLPYGLQKRVALARALASEPSLLLLDEPASGLSESEMDELKNLIGELQREMGVLVVEHNMDLVMATCDRIVVLDFGRVIADGTPDAVRADPLVTTAYLGEEVSAATGGEAGTP